MMGIFRRRTFKLSKADIRRARSHKYGDEMLWNKASKSAASDNWLERFRAEAKRRKIRTREKRWGQRWRRSSTATGQLISFSRGFSKRELWEQAKSWAHELHHSRWQIAVGAVGWLAQWAASPQWRWAYEVAAKRDEYRMASILGHGLPLRIGIDADVKRFVKFYRLKRIKDVERLTKELLLEAL